MSSFLSLFQTDTLLLFIVLIQGFYLEVKQSTQEAEISEIVLLRLQNCHIRSTQTAQVGSVSYFNDSQARAGTRKSCKQIWLKSSPKDYVVPTDYKRQTSRNLAKKIKKNTSQRHVVFGMYFFLILEDVELHEVTFLSGYVQLHLMWVIYFTSEQQWLLTDPRAILPLKSKHRNSLTKSASLLSIKLPVLL